MSVNLMSQAVQLIRRTKHQVKSEALGNISLETIRAVAKIGLTLSLLVPQ